VVIYSTLLALLLYSTGRGLSYYGPYYWAMATGSSNEYKEFLGGIGWYVNGSVIKLPKIIYVNGPIVLAQPMYVH
jgi:hypothetical protein